MDNQIENSEGQAMENSQENSVTNSDEQAVPMHERVILAFLARPSKIRSEDDNLLAMLETPLAQKIGYALSHPDEPPPNMTISRLAERLFLDANNQVSARLIRKHKTVDEDDPKKAKIAHNLHAALA